MHYMRKKAYSYIRFSSAEQAKGSSYARQREACEEYCRANQLELASESEYTFFDKGVSGFKGKHAEVGELAKIIALVQNGSIEAGSYLIVESLDRLGRDEVLSALSRFIDLLGAGINIVTLGDNKVYSGTVDTMQIMYSLIIMGRAHDESRTKALRVGDAWRRKKELARSDNIPTGANCPMWLQYAKPTGYSVHEDRVAVVRKIFELTINGYGRNAVAKMLNASGIQSFKGTTWGSSSVGKILNNRALLGEYQPFSIVGRDKREPVGEPIQGYFPVVLDEATFYSGKAATEGRRLSKATKQSESFNVWSGIIFCFLCNSPMHLVDKGRPPKGAKYLQCSSAKKGLCECKVVRLDRSEIVFKEILAKVDALALVQSSSGEIQRSLNVLRGKIAEEHSKLEEYKLLMREKPSASLAELLSECEVGIGQMTADETHLNKELAADKIIDKAAFMSKVDVETYAGRSHANAVMKRLKIQVFANTRVSKEGTLYLVKKNGARLMVVADQKGEVTLHPHSEEAAATMRLQNELGPPTESFRVTFTPKS